MRLIRYPEERNNLVREIKVRSTQNFNIRNNFSPSSERLIIFIVPGADRYTGKETISGGVISLVSLCEETEKLKNIHGSDTLMCTFPRDFLLFKHVNFENSVDVYRFEQIVGYFTKVKSILIHLPDDLAQPFEGRLFQAELKWLKAIPKIQINIVNANILLMPPINVLKELAKLPARITMTAAHSRYCTPYFRNLYGVPLHKFSTWVSPEQYIFRPYAEKENIIVISPDENPERDKILEVLGRRKDLNVITLRGMSHDQFKETISRAKWTLTFGEGLDGYLVEPIFSGAIGFAVFNEDFFTEDFRALNGIYSSYETMADRLLDDIRDWDSEAQYATVQKRQFDTCAKHYNFDEYKSNIRKFYEGDYTFK